MAQCGQKRTRRRGSIFTEFLLSSFMDDDPNLPIQEWRTAVWSSMQQEWRSRRRRWCKAELLRRAKLQSDHHHQRIQLSVFFYRPDAIPAVEATESKHWRTYRVVKKSSSICAAISKQYNHSTHTHTHTHTNRNSKSSSRRRHKTSLAKNECIEHARLPTRLHEWWLNHYRSLFAQIGNLLTEQKLNLNSSLTLKSDSSVCKQWILASLCC